MSLLFVNNVDGDELVRISAPGCIPRIGEYYYYDAIEKYCKVVKVVYLRSNKANVGLSAVIVIDQLRSFTQMDNIK